MNLSVGAFFRFWASWSWSVRYVIFGVTHHILCNHSFVLFQQLIALVSEML
jgi:hypothetical protein